jgi:3-hydroxyisobutyrate dehydrogenase
MASLIFKRVVLTRARHTRGYATSPKEWVGFIGLGQMGSRMVRNVLKSGRGVVVHDLDQQATAKLQSEYGSSVQCVSDPAAVGAHKDIWAVVSVLPASQHVKSVLIDGAKSVLAGSKSRDKPLLFIDASTIDPTVAKQVREEIVRAGRGEMIDAPISGGVGGAEKGTLTFMVGGEETAFTQARPLLESMGKNIVHCGANGTGQVAKVCNNLLLGISMIGVSEAFNLGMRLGIAPQVLAAIINSSSGRCWSSEVYNPVPGVVSGVPASNEYKGGFGVPLMAKDLNLALGAAIESKTPLPLGSVAAQVYTLLSQQQGYAQLDFGSVFKYLNESNHLNKK